MSCCFSMDEMKKGFVKFIGIGVHIQGFRVGFCGRVASQNRVLNRPAPLFGFLGQFINPVTTANRSRYFPGIGRWQTDDFAVFIKIRHFNPKTIAKSPYGLNILFDNAFRFFLHSFLNSLYFIPSHGNPIVAITGINRPSENPESILLFLFS